MARESLGQHWSERVECKRRGGARGDAAQPVPGRQHAKRHQARRPGELPPAVETVRVAPMRRACCRDAPDYRLRRARQATLSTITRCALAGPGSVARGPARSRRPQLARRTNATAATSAPSKPAAARRALRRTARRRKARARSMCARITSTGTPAGSGGDARQAISGNFCSSRFDMVIASNRSDAPGAPHRLAPRLGARDADVAQHLITQLHERAALARPVVPGQQRSPRSARRRAAPRPEGQSQAARRSFEGRVRHATLEPGSQAAHTIRPTLPERPASVPSVSLPSRHHLLVWLPT